MTQRAVIDTSQPITDQVSASLDGIRKALEDWGWTKTAVDRHEAPGGVPLAVETGFKYGEVTTKIWEQHRGRNTGAPLQVIRGYGTAYVEDVLLEIEGRERDLTPDSGSDDW